MDVEKLIERLKEPDCDECTYEEKRECAGSAKCVLSGYAAEALSTLQAENEKLRADLARVTAERDAAILDLEIETIGTPRACDCCENRENPQCKRNLLYGWCKWEWRGIEKED